MKRFGVAPCWFAESAKAPTIIRPKPPAAMSAGLSRLSAMLMVVALADGSELDRGPEDVKRFMGEFRSAFPDFHTTIEDQIAEGDRVATRWTMRGTHEGEFRGIPATGNQISVTGIGIFRFSDGKVVESWDNFDQLGMMQQLGVVPSP